MIRLGYASQNLTIGASTGHTLRLANLSDVPKVKGVVQENLSALERIVTWNAESGIGLFRMSPQFIPLASHPDFPYDWQLEHGPELERVGDLAWKNKIRLSVHPGQYIHPASLNPDVVQRSLDELRYNAKLLSCLGSRDGVIVLHLGGSFGDKTETIARFVEALRREREILRYLALENDERVWTVAQVWQAADALGVPVIVDTLHHELNPGAFTLQTALELALPTWPGRPKLHISTQDPDKQRGAHAWGIAPQDWRSLTTALAGRPVDVMVEAKGKDQAVLALLSAPHERRAFPSDAVQLLHGAA
ncbi:MAG: UV DNA damage repair endonuclease UvsE [Armatimonadota bacterium]|nr:UV DNA damage repair endonuclease UvsE [Armatimonadota bacterium]